LANEQILLISCGGNHTLALNKNGEVFAWGDNSYGQIGVKIDSYILIPLKVNGFKEKVKYISCGSAHPMALTKSGHVFIWGHIGIAIKNLENLMEPKLIEMNDVFICKISCGFAHSLMLSTDGDIYTIGFNNYGQLGIGDRKDKWSPIKLEIQNNFVDIGSTHFENICVGSEWDLLLLGSCWRQRYSLTSEVRIQINS
jgi:alpha-tubulin suppressor-like RCC1 family protein